MKLGGEMPASTANEKVLREHRENERKNIHILLVNYQLFCRQMGARAEKEYIESDSIEEGIVELIRLNGIKRLVMGAAMDKRHFKFQIGRRMTQNKSRIAIFVRDKAPISCQIWFIYDGQLIHTREAQMVQAVVEVPTNVPLPTTSSPGAVMPPPSSSLDRSPVHPNVRLYAEKLKEELEKVMEELRIARAQKSQLKDQFVETDQSRKELELKIIASEEMLRALIQERELLRTEPKNALLKAEEESRRKGDSSGTKYFSEFSFTEIAEAAQNFDPSLKIGKGGYGTVYRGLLRLTPVAIKIMNGHSTRGSQDFQQEINVLREVRHPNLITLIGACPEPCTLVYEYIPNGSLEHWLHDSDRAKQLPWRARICIATELCSALAFLHSWKPHSIVHGDVKPGNILLDAHFKSKLSDFGMSRLLSGGKRSSNNTTVVHLTKPKGTIGYIDPKFLVTGELTTSSDVYSLGIVLLELLTRRPASGIANVVRKAIKAGTLAAILDPSAGEWPYTLAKKFTHLALSCCEMSRRNRPDLKSEVGTVLQSIRASC